MSESLTALYLQNPELATALRRRQEAQALMQQGGDASPIRSPWQGAARMAQALLGGYEAGRADQDVKGLADRDRQDLTDALGRNAGLIRPGAAPAAPMTAPQQPVAQAALAPPDIAPLIEQASQRSGVPAPILTGLYAQESSFRPDARNPRSTATGIGQVLDSTAAAPGFGMAPLSAQDRLDPTKAIPWSADYLAARGKALGVTDWNNPQQAALALRAYGENTPEYAQSVLGRAGMGAPAGSPPAQGAPATGANAPMVQSALALMDEGQRNAISNNPRLRALGATQMQRAQTLMTLDTYANTPDGGQVNVRTGKIEYPPTPRMATDSQGNLIAVRPGGGTSVVSAGGSSPGVNTEANAVRTLQSAKPDSQEYRDAYAALYGERTEMTPSGPQTYRPRTPPAGLAEPTFGVAPAAPGGATPPAAGVTYAAPVTANVDFARKNGIPLADTNPYQGMSAAEQQKAKTEALATVRDRNAKRDEADDQAGEVILGLKRFKELNKGNTTGPLYKSGVVAGVGGMLNPELQEMQAITSKITPLARAAGSGTTSDFDARMMGQATVGIDKPRQVNENIADAHILVAENRQAKKAFVENYVEANGHEQGAERMWRAYLEANPIFDPKETASFGLNKGRVDWQTWFRNAVDPQTGKLREGGAPGAGVMRFDRNGNLVGGN